jgi:hypothetical protein
LISGFFAAIPVLTRGLQFIGAPVETAMMKDWSLVSPFHAAVYLSIALFAGTFLLSLLSPRFWCKYVCPSGATFSVFSFLRAAERKVDPTCAGCGSASRSAPSMRPRGLRHARKRLHVLSGCGGARPRTRSGSRPAGPAGAEPREVRPPPPGPSRAARSWRRAPPALASAPCCWEAALVPRPRLRPGTSLDLCILAAVLQGLPRPGPPPGLDNG